MVQFKPFGKRDIFGILLPGFILVLIIGYIFLVVYRLFNVTTIDLLGDQFLLILIFLVTAYIFGSFLRLFAADDIDKKSGLKILKAWNKNYRKSFSELWLSPDNSIVKKIINYNTKALKRCKKKDIVTEKMDNPDFFINIVDEWESEKKDVKNKEKYKKIQFLLEEWLWRVDIFPYHAWLKQFWKSHGFKNILNFYKSEYKNYMWGSGRSSPKSFFNYCKLAIEGKKESQFIENVNVAESHTRYLAGSTIAYTFACLISGVFFILTLLVYFLNQIMYFLPKKVDITLLIVYSIITLLLGITCLIIRNQMIKKFRMIRLQEVEIVYYAFYLLNNTHNK